MHAQIQGDPVRRPDRGGSISEDFLDAGLIKPVMKRDEGPNFKNILSGSKNTLFCFRAVFDRRGRVFLQSNLWGGKLRPCTVRSDRTEGGPGNLLGGGGGGGGRGVARKQALRWLEREKYSSPTRRTTRDEVGGTSSERYSKAKGNRLWGPAWGMGRSAPSVGDKERWSPARGETFPNERDLRKMVGRPETNV